MKTACKVKPEFLKSKKIVTMEDTKEFVVNAFDILNYGKHKNKNTATFQIFTLEKLNPLVKIHRDSQGIETWQERTFRVSSRDFGLGFLGSAIIKDPVNWSWKNKPYINDLLRKLKARNINPEISQFKEIETIEDVRRFVANAFVLFRDGIKNKYTTAFSIITLEPIHMSIEICRDSQGIETWQAKYFKVAETEFRYIGSAIIRDPVNWAWKNQPYINDWLQNHYGNGTIKY